MIIFFACALFFLGAALGSFLNNVFVVRYDPARPLFFTSHFTGRSRCMKCGKTISSSSLIPIFSFLFLRGKCAVCKEKISFQYPLVEIISGFIVAGVPIFLARFYGISIESLFSFSALWWQYALLGLWTAVFLAWLVMLLIDIKHYIIPDEFHIFFALSGAAIAALLVFYGDALIPFRESFVKNYTLIFSPFAGIVGGRIAGSLIAGMFFAALFAASKGRGMGMGDVKLAFSSGILLGWPDVGVAIFFSFLFGGIWAATAFFLKIKKMKDRVPFAPFLVLGFVAAVFFGHAIIEWYFSALFSF